MKDAKLLEYIPKRKRTWVKEIYRDSDGIWCYLKEGYIDTDMGTTVVHAETIRQLIMDFKNVEEVII